MTGYRQRRSGFIWETLNSINANPYMMTVRLKAEDKEYLRRALVKFEQDVGILPSNALLISHLIRKYTEQPKV